MALGVNEETGFKEADLLGTLALAYHESGQGRKAVETQEQVVSLIPEDEVWPRGDNERRLLIYRGEGRRDFDLARVLTGTWSGAVGPVQSAVEFHREGGGFTVHDVGSLNGTYVNREPVDVASLAGGDEVQIGKFRLVYLTGPRTGEPAGA